MNDEPNSIPTDWLFTASQEQWVAFLPFPGGIVSILASCIIILIVCRSKFDSSYKRILFGLSVSDVVISIVWILDPFLLPRATSHREFAIGNETTCNMIGVLTHFAISNTFYAAFLALYFMLTIRFRILPDTFAKGVERWMHLFIGVFSIAACVISLQFRLYGEKQNAPACWTVDTCIDENGAEICNETVRQWAVVVSGMVPMVVCCLVLIGANLAICCHVRRLMLRGSMVSTNSSTQTNRTHMVATQSFWYVTVYLATWIWVWFCSMIDPQYLSIPSRRFFVVMAGFCTPFTGLFNLLVYLRPRYLRRRARVDDESRCTSLWRVLGEELTPRRCDRRKSVLPLCKPPKNHIEVKVEHEEEVSQVGPSDGPSRSFSTAMETAEHFDG